MKRFYEIKYNKKLDRKLHLIIFIHNVYERLSNFDIRNILDYKKIRLFGFGEICALSTVATRALRV